MPGGGLTGRHVVVEPIEPAKRPVGGGSMMSRKRREVGLKSEKQMAAKVREGRNLREERAEGVTIRTKQKQ